MHTNVVITVIVWILVSQAFMFLTSTQHFTVDQSNLLYLTYFTNIYLLLLSRQVVAWHRPYCVDLEESTFSHLRSFLERYCDGINSEVPPLPFPSSR